MNYTIFDVETANHQRDSICAIGIIRYENNRVVYEKEILINPEVEFNYFNTRIHGIKESDVVDAPTFRELWPEIKNYFDNTILVAHNAKSMDLCALYKTLERYGLSTVNNKYICTMELAKQIYANDNSVQTYRLNSLAKLHNIELRQHHNALSDAKACFELLKKFEECYPQTVVAQQYYYNSKSNSCCEGSVIEGVYSNKTREMQKLQVLVIGIIEDKDISNDEINELKEWVERHEELKGFYPFDKIFELVEDVMVDGILDQTEKQELLKLLDAFINPETSNVAIEFAGKSVCLSGEFNYGSKKQVEDFLITKGAIIAKGVTGKLDVLILGEAGSAAWKYGNYGSKYEKAKQLNEKGKSIIIVKETDVIH